LPKYGAEFPSNSTGGDPTMRLKTGAGSVNRETGSWACRVFRPTSVEIFVLAPLTRSGHHE
jgi:hypothetical protein